MPSLRNLVLKQYDISGGLVQVLSVLLTIPLRKPGNRWVNYWSYLWVPLSLTIVQTIFSFGVDIPLFTTFGELYYTVSVWTIVYIFSFDIDFSTHTCGSKIYFDQLLKYGFENRLHQQAIPTGDFDSTRLLSPSNCRKEQ